MKAKREKEEREKEEARKEEKMIIDRNREIKKENTILNNEENDKNKGKSQKFFRNLKNPRHLSI